MLFRLLALALCASEQTSALFTAAKKAEEQQNKSGVANSALAVEDERNRLSKDGFFMLCALGTADFSRVRPRKLVVVTFFFLFRFFSILFFLFFIFALCVLLRLYLTSPLSFPPATYVGYTRTSLRSSNRRSGRGGGNQQEEEHGRMYGAERV